MATKRAPRPILKAADICAQDPQRAARYLVAKSTSSMRRRLFSESSRVFSVSRSHSHWELLSLSSGKIRPAEASTRLTLLMKTSA